MNFIIIIFVFGSIAPDNDVLMFRELICVLAEQQFPCKDISNLICF